MYALEPDTGRQRVPPWQSASMQQSSVQYLCGCVLDPEAHESPTHSVSVLQSVPLWLLPRLLLVAAQDVNTPLLAA